MKKFISVLLAVVLMTGMTTTVFARGHGNSNSGNCNNSVYSVPRYLVCTVENCVLTEPHSHNNQTYCTHYYGDGHAYHEYCDIEDCVLTGYHEHDGIYCFGHTVNDGHEYHSYCNVADCIYAGYHEHDGAYCFAHTANDGHGHRNMGNCHR